MKASTACLQPRADKTQKKAEQALKATHCMAWHGMGLADMNTALDQNPLAGSEATGGSAAVAGGVATGINETSSVPSVMDSCQEATDSAAREMTSC